MKARSRLVRPASVKRGASAWAILVALALGALVLALAVGLAARRGGEQPGLRPERVAGAGGPGGVLAHETPDAARVQSAPASAPRGEDPARFQGRGRIRGELLAADVELPASWTLVVEPHPWLVGADRAVTRRVALAGGARTFDVEDLPLGGYRVRAEAARANSTEESVLLVRSANDVFVTLTLRPSGFLDGFVTAPGGAPADGVDVVLEDARSHTRRVVTTDPTGMYTFRDVLDGEYRILFGAPERPLVPAGDLVFRAPSLRYRTVELPVTGELDLSVRDDRGAPVPDADVTGYGVPQGSARGRSGPDGVARLRWLWPGRYHLEVAAPDGRAGKGPIVVREQERVEAVIEVR